MEITITWTKIIVLLAFYFGGRYAYSAWQKWTSGSPYPFDPTCSYETSSYYNGWRMGNIHGSARAKVKYEQKSKQLQRLKERYAALQAKTARLESRVAEEP